MKIIAIETSHDDTSVVLYENRKILQQFAFSQTDFHKQFGGTVPEYASRRHCERLMEILPALLKLDLSNLNHVAYTNEPGLIGSLHMGRLFAKALALALKVPAKPINHMYGHIFAVAFNVKITYPALALIASGGHTQLWEVKELNKIDLIGQTQDDAAGEAYDKVARALNLGFPGGPVIDKLYDAKKVTGIFDLKVSKDHNFSFSGLKTKVLNYINNCQQKKAKLDTAFIASNFQSAIVKYLIAKTKQAITVYHPQAVILGGGVAANSLLRKEFAKIYTKVLIPDLEFTTDNAMMIAMRSALKEQNESNASD